MDDAAARRIQDQLSLWGEEIRKREARLQTPGREPRFAAVLHVDELRIMLVTVQTKFQELQADPTGPRDLLTAEFDRVWKELGAAMDRPMPRP